MNLDSDLISKELLESFGYSVFKIPESDKKEADFTVSLKDCNECMLIEAKLITDSKETYIKKEEMLKKGNIYSYDAMLGMNNKISKITSNAKKQLLSSADKKCSYKLILYIAMGVNPHTKAEQILDTLYGRTRIFISGEKIIKDCFYFRVSKFYSYRDIIDGAIIAEQSLIDENKFNLQLCLNSFSKNYNNLKYSCLVKNFNKAIVDPINKEKNGEIFIPDNNISRTFSGLGKYFTNSNYNLIMNHLNEKYNLNDFLIAIDFETPSIFWH